MGGDKNNHAVHAKKASKDDVNEWLQIVIDALGNAYGWTKDAIFMLYPAEVEILMRRINKRKEVEDDAEFLRMVYAALAPHMEDRGKSLINTVSAKHKTITDNDDVTPESIAREMAIARALLQR